MAYGLRISDESGNLWFDSETTFGFIEITNFTVSTNGTTNNSASGTLPGYSEIFVVYTPSAIDANTSGSTRRPLFTTSFNTGSGAWTVNQTWGGTNTGVVAAGGGRAIIFGH